MQILTISQGFNNNALDLWETENDTLSLFAINSGSSQLMGPLWQNQFQTLEAIHNSAGTANLYLNGAPVAQSTSMQNLANVTRNASLIGTGDSSGYFQGQVAEILVYNRNLTDAERIGVETYFTNRYNFAPPQAVTAPVFNIAAGTLAGPSQVALAASVGAEIHATTDGSTPTSASPLITAPIQVNYTQTIKAISVLNGVSSSVASATYTLNSTQWPAPDPTDTTPLKFNLQLPAPAL